MKPGATEWSVASTTPVLVGMVLVLLTTTLPCAPHAAAQTWEEQFELGRRQQPFVSQYVRERPPPLPLTPEGVDVYLDTLERAWSREIGATAHTPPWKRDVDAGLYYVMLRLFVVGGPLDREVRCHLFAQHMAPAFVESVDRFAEAPAAGRLYGLVSLTQVGLPDHAVGCETPAEQWAELHEGMRRLPGLIEAFLDSEAGPEAAIQATLERAVRRFETVRPLFAVRDALNRAELDTAFAALAALSARNDVSGSYLVVLGESLWRRYAAGDRRDRALATLDLMSQSIAAGDLPSDSLRAWYEQVDARQGARRFERAARGERPPTLIASDRHIPLTGTYRDLRTGESFDLSTLQGRTVLFDFWATWCTPCIEEIPRLRAFVAQHEGDVVLISVSGDAVTGGAKAEGAAAFVERHGIDYVALFDDPERSLTERFGVEGWPSKYLVGRDGVLLTRAGEERDTVTLTEVDAYLSETP